MSSQEYNPQEIHNLGMNFIGEILEKDGFEFLAVNSQLKKHPQFVCHKPKEATLFVVVQSVLYPNDPNEFDEKLLDRMIDHTNHLDYRLWLAGVGFANATDLDNVLTKADDFIVKFDGFKKVI